MTIHHIEQPTDQELRNARLIFLKQNRRKDYREMKASGELEEHLNQMVTAVRSHAEALIQTGAFLPAAWNWAIRSVLLESNRE